MKKIIIPTGYMCSGSSAVTDLLSEFENVSNVAGSQEFVFLHCPNGLFDLERNIIQPNSIFSSDEYIFQFKKQMKNLYDTKFWWPGNYNNYIGPEFMKYVDDFINEITDYTFTNNYWYMQELPIGFAMKIKKIIWAIKMKIGFKPTQILNRNKLLLSFNTKNNFYDASKRFINNVISKLGNDDIKIIDQLILPANINKMPLFFDDNYKAIVVERDPRDVFIANKYFYYYQHSDVPYPHDVKEFCDFYKKMRSFSKYDEYKNVLKINFEDLIYDYDNTVKVITDFCDININTHINMKKNFIPEKSINNTQLFSTSKKYTKEVKIIERELKEYLYPFPKKNKANVNEVF